MAIPNFHHYEKDDYFDFAHNDHLQGECPHCQRWEAPITIEQLTEAKLPKYVFLGSSEEWTDDVAVYERKMFLAFFCCPRCHKRFTIPFSDI